jgi:predicted DNA-binding transcriptional regulator AlpA
MTSRSEAVKLLKTEVLDIHGVGKLLGISRSSVNTLIVRDSADFPRPIYESRGSERHPVRLWWREDIEKWSENRPSSRTSSAPVKSKSKKGEAKK